MNRGNPLNNVKYSLMNIGEIGVRNVEIALGQLINMNALECFIPMMEESI